MIFPVATRIRRILSGSRRLVEAQKNAPGRSMLRRARISICVFSSAFGAAGTRRGRLALQSLTERILELLAGLELRGAACRNLNRLAGLGIAAGARLAFRDRERAEARDIHALALLQCRDDVLEDDVDCFFSFGLVHWKLVGQSLD